MKERLINWFYSIKPHLTFNRFVVAMLLVLSPFYYFSHPFRAPQSSQQLQQQAAHEVRQASATAPLQLVTEPDDGVAPVENAIARSAHSVDLVMYEMDDQTIEQDLADAAQRGVAVRVILQNISSFGKHPNQATYDFLSQHGVNVHWASTSFFLTHQKTLIIDNQNALIMTFNLQPRYYATARDFGVIDHDLTDVAAIEQVFNADWSGNAISPSIGNDLVWSPGSRQALLALINSATSALDVYNEEMNDEAITSALEQAADRGVAVRVDMTYATNWKAAFNELANHGVLVQTYSSGSKAKRYIHAKAIIADREKAFMGSENFSAASLDSNRELGIITARPDIITSLESTFQSDWQGSRPHQPKI